MRTMPKTGVANEVSHLKSSMAVRRLIAILVSLRGRGDGDFCCCGVYGMERELVYLGWKRDGDGGKAGNI